MTFGRYLWGLTRRSFHGTFRFLEIGEAVTALVVHVAGYFFHEWKELLEVAFVVLTCLLVLTFFVGLLVAAYASQKETEEKLVSATTKSVLDPEQQQFADFVHRNAQDPTDFKIVDWGQRANDLRRVRFRCRLVGTTPSGKFQPFGPEEKGGESIMLEHATISYKDDQIQTVHCDSIRTFWH